MLAYILQNNKGAHFSFSVKRFIVIHFCSRTGREDSLVPVRVRVWERTFLHFSFRHRDELQTLWHVISHSYGNTRGSKSSVTLEQLKKNAFVKRKITAGIIIVLGNSIKNCYICKQHILLLNDSTMLKNYLITQRLLISSSRGPNILVTQRLSPFVL